MSYYDTDVPPKSAYHHIVIIVLYGVTTVGTVGEATTVCAMIASCCAGKQYEFLLREELHNEEQQ